MSLRKLRYNAYLQTDHWKEVRDKALEYAEFACQLCNESDMKLNVHHRTYKNLGNEKPCDVTVLCEECHCNFHKITKLKRNNPKHSGGKKTYVMLMLQQFEEFKNKNINNIEELVGFLVCLSYNMEWRTGRLVHRRNKKQLKYADLLKLFSGGKRKLDRIMKDLKKYELLTHTKEGYFISNKLIKKGSNVAF